MTNFEVKAPGEFQVMVGKNTYKKSTEFLSATNRPWDQTNLILNSIEKVKPDFLLIAAHKGGRDVECVRKYVDGNVR